MYLSRNNKRVENKNTDRCRLRGASRDGPVISYIVGLLERERIYRWLETSGDVCDTVFICNSLRPSIF